MYLATNIRIFALVAICYLVDTHTLLAQTKQIKSNRLTFAIAPQYNLNQANASSDGVGPQPITARNTSGGYIALGYERVTKTGIVFSVDAQVVQQPHDITVTYTFNGFDPNASNVLDNSIPFVKNYRTTLTYLTQRFMLGYEKEIGKADNGLRLQGKVGLRTGSRLSRMRANREEDQYIQYLLNDNSGYIFTAFTRIRTNIDPVSPPSANLHAGFGLVGYDIYLGLVQTTNRRWLNSVSFGLELAGGVRPNRPTGAILFETTSFDKSGNIIGTDNYYSRGRSLALRVGLNFWK